MTENNPVLVVKLNQFSTKRLRLPRKLFWDWNVLSVKPRLNYPWRDVNISNWVVIKNKKVKLYNSNSVIIVNELINKHHIIYIYTLHIYISLWNVLLFSLILWKINFFQEYMWIKKEKKVGFFWCVCIKLLYFNNEYIISLYKWKVSNL